VNWKQEQHRTLLLTEKRTPGSRTADLYSCLVRHSKWVFLVAPWANGRRVRIRSAHCHFIAIESLAKKQRTDRPTLSMQSLTYFKVIGGEQEQHRTLLLTEKEDPRISHCRFSIVGPRQAEQIPGS
jgi:hypothetical protein